MFPRLAPVLLALGLALSPLQAAVKKAPPAPAPDPDVTTYYVCVLTKGLYAGVGLKEERIKTQAAQHAYIDRLAREGKLLVAGPVTDASDWRGLYIFKCASLSEARTLVNADPEVLAGRLRFEIHAWQTAKGSILDPAFPAAH
jgi:uncharacterized protein YciI